LLAKIKKFITDVFWLVVTILIWGIVGGLAVFLTIEFIRYAYFWALIVTAFFSIFHFSDLKIFYLTKNLPAFFGRLFCLFIISSYISGFFVFASGLMELTIDTIDSIIFLISIVISYISTAFFMILRWYFSDSKLYSDTRKIIKGLEVIGVFWKNTY
jgi:hypothetical protein